MNKILRTLNKFAEKNGWDDSTKISIMARFIEQFGDGSGEDVDVHAYDALCYELEIESFNEFIEDMENQKENLKSYLEDGDKTMSVIKAEVYYGFYSGNSQLWDTLYVYIPAETPESDIESVAVEKFYEEYGDAENVAFTGLFHWEYDEDCGCGDCESCNEE